MDDGGDYLYDEAPEDMKSPISLKLMTDPVMAMDGRVSEKGGRCMHGWLVPDSSRLLPPIT